VGYEYCTADVAMRISEYLKKNNVKLKKFV
jgi:hypothetical protein